LSLFICAHDQTIPDIQSDLYHRSLQQHQNNILSVSVHRVALLVGLFETQSLADQQTPLLNMAQTSFSSLVCIQKYLQKVHL